MSVLDEYNRLKKKRLGLTDDEDKSNGGSSVTSVLSEYNRLKAERLAREGKEEDIAPVISPSTSTKEEEEEDESGWFKSGAFDDGYQFGDGISSVLSTVGDVGVNALKGAGGLVEGVTDLILYGVSGVSDLVGADSFADDVKRLAQQQSVNDALSGVEDFVDQHSFLGDKSDAVAQGIGQVATIIATGGIAGAAGLSAAGATALTTGLMGASSFGSGMGEAYQSGASDEEALAYGAMKGIVDAGTELIFGGLGKTVKALGLSKGISSLDDVFAKKLSSKISNQFVSNAVQFGVKASAEGTEEVLAGLGSAVAKKLTYMSEEDLGKLVEDENLLDQFVVGAVTSGLTQSGIVPGMKNGSLLEANEKGRDFITGLSSNEQKVVDKIYEDRIAEESEKGDVSKKRKSEIYDEVLNEMEKGYFSTDTIDEMFGGDAYKAYKDNIAKEEALRKEYDELYNMKNGDKSSAQVDREAELKKMMEDIDKGTTRAELQSKLRDEVFGTINGSRLVNSYIDSENRLKVYADDATKQTNKYAKATIENAIKSGVVNNSNRAHEMTETLSKISSDQNVVYDYVNDKIIAEQGRQKQRKVTKTFTADGKTAEFSLNTKRMDSNVKPVVKVGNTVVENYTVDYETGNIVFDSAPKKGKITVDYGAFDRINGWIETLEDGTKKITLNMDSNEVWQFTTGHEITHKLEGTKKYSKFRDVLYQYAKDKGDYDGLMDSVKKRYDEGTDYDSEVTADLVGRYLFQDEDFVKHLSVNHRNVFQWLWDEVKHLSKLVTAGSKEARQLEKVKHAFENAYREGGKANAKTGTQYSLNVNAKEELHKALYDTKYRNEVLLRDESPPIMLAQKGVSDRPMVMNASHIRENVFTEEEARKLGLRIDEHTHYHGIGEEFFLKIIDGLDNVKEAYRGTKYASDSSRRENYFLLVSEFKDQNGNTINVPVYIDERAQVNRVFVDVNKISTVFGRDSFRDYINKQIQEKNLVRIKNRSTQSSERNALIAKGYGKDTSADDIVPQTESEVKHKFSISDSDGNQLTEEQQEYFKDSKVRDENGNLKVVYHGSGSEFTEFSYDFMSSHGSSEGQGFYFTDSENMAKGYQQNGTKLMKGYLDIKKPLSDSEITLKRNELSKLLKEIDPSGDDVIINYDPTGGMGYPSKAWYNRALAGTVDSMLQYNSSDSEILADIANSGAGTQAVLEKVRGLLGYDGYIVKGKYDGADVYVAFESNQFKNMDNTAPTPDSDIRFSVSMPVEETKELMAIHNLHTNEVLKQLDMGGLVYPSVAITDPSKIAHGDFGEVSLILRKEAIDPKNSKYNKIYSTDAYTPTFPHISYEANRVAADNVARRVNAHFGELHDYYQSSLQSLRDNTNLNDVLNRNGGYDGMISNFIDDYGMKQLYLAEKGAAVPMVVDRTETEISDVQKRMYQSVVDRLGADEINAFNDRGYHQTLADARMEWLQKNLDDLKDVITDDWASDGTMTKAEAMEIADEQKKFYWYKEADAVYEYLQNGGVTVEEKENYNATNAKIDEKIANSDYKQWLSDLFSGIEGQSGIRNSKDTFTPSGNRRSFSQLHDPVTIDNVINTMRKKDQQGEGAFGIGNIFGASAKEYGSIAEAKKNSGELGVIAQEEYDAIKERVENRLFDIAGRYSNGKDIIDAKNTLVEAVAKYETKAQIAKFLKQYDYVYKYADSIANDLISLRDYIRSLPRPYFEAKPQRAVGFDEVAVFVIPRNADVKLKQELLNRGYSIAEYDPDVEGDRQKVVNQFEEYKFSLSDASETTNKYGSFATPMSEVRYEAPTQEEVAPVQEVAEEVETPAPVAPVQAELPDEYNDLLREKADLERRIMEAATEGNENEAQLAAEYKALTDRINQIEADESAMQSDRFASLTDEDVPPEMETQIDSISDNISLPQTAVSWIAKNVRTSLGLSDGQMSDVYNLIQEYSRSEFPSREQLFNSVREKFGTYTDTHVDERIKEIKAKLRNTGINVSDAIKNDIADYGELRRSNFGKVRFSKQGIPVDSAYMDFVEMYPEYFDESITNPTDQLLRIVDIANTNTNQQTTLDVDEDSIWEAVDAIVEGVDDYKQITKQRLYGKYSNDARNSLMKDAYSFVPSETDVIAEDDIAPIPTQSVGVEETAPTFDATPKKGVAEGQQALWEEPAAEEKLTRKALHERIVESVKSVFKADGFDFDQVLKKAKNLSTFATVDNTPQRVMEKALGYKEGQILSDLTVNKVAQNETEGIKWLSSFTDRKNGVLAQMSKQYGIKPGSKESAAAQMYAEGYYVSETGKDGEYVKGKSEIIKYGDAELAKDFPDANVRENIKKLARDPRIRQIYDETLAAINESRARNGYPEIPRLENYFMHFRAMEDTFSRLGLPFNPNDIKAKDLPTDLNGVTADLKPGQPYFASAMHRTGKRTSFDLLGGMERYLSSAKNQIYHIDDIQTLRALRNYIADTFGQANGLSNIDSMTEEEAQERIKEVYGSHLSTFAKFLNEEANVLAGKTALIDRGFEGILGRRGIQFLETLNSQVGSNMVGFNLSSSLTNFLPVVQTFAKSNKAAFVKAFAQTVSNKVNSIYGKSDGFAENSSVIIRRKGADRFYRTPYQKIGDVGYVFMSAVDDISTELIARTKYNEFIKKGMSEQQAHHETDKWVSRLMGDRSLGQMPQLYNSKMLGLVTKFQLEVRNQLDSQFYDTIQEAKEANENIQDKSARNAKTAAKVASTFFQLAVAQHLFGMAFESVAGYNPAFDIIDAIIKTFGWDDEEDSEDTALDNIEQGFLTLLEDMPYASTFMDGGRIPISSALPISELIKGEDQYGMEKSRWETAGEVAPYYVLPGGYGQLKKSVQGLSMFSDDHPVAGSYTDSGNLRFPVEDTFGNRLQAGIFGQWANENARDYFDNERSALNEKQTQEYIDLEMPIRDYWEYREGLKKQETLEDKFDYIAGLDVSVKQKNIMINNVVDRAEEVDMSNYDDFGSFEEFDFYTKNTEKYNFLQENNVSYSEYMESDDSKEKYDSIYSWVNNYPDKVTVSKAVTDNVIEYRGYVSALYDIKADKDEDGKSITGSRKDKVIDYVNNLDIDYGARLILFKSEYPSDDTYNYDIINYLEENDAISGEEMRTILTELGFHVSDDGTISWD